MPLPCFGIYVWDGKRLKDWNQHKKYLSFLIAQKTIEERLSDKIEFWASAE
jgi:hypothetical protein